MRKTRVKWIREMLTAVVMDKGEQRKIRPSRSALRQAKKAYVRARINGLRPERAVR